ncbi:hypothetical protein [Paenibacillus jilunlii]|uniref:Uncharacterized protein n=1 Tax=Paenibacillus jilunlii TaxID=682956 RepID=A0A1G9WFK9_9BACL|nr:hypothetical protein [Paenibacillus jilunlii]KWX73515.1 hypothetical protein AML91_17695 [Paenibacillus jilunlii]SDM83344.1 hypothetical protein SAMN05216191_11956 [Paenibacillus jilunlii]
MNFTEMSFDDLMEEAYGLPGGKAKLELLEQAVRVADAAGDIDQGYEARSEIVELGSFHGYPMKALVAFSWQLGQYDKNPGRFDDYSLMWSYKWVLDRISAFAEISRVQIENLLEDMKTRFAAEGYSSRTYHYYRAKLLADFGELDASEAEWDIVQSMERDEMSDCEACEQHGLVEFLAKRNEDEKTVKAAEPILKGRMTCGEVPHVTITKVLFPLLRLGRQSEADKLQKKGYKLVKGNRDFLYHQGEHIGYLTLTDPIKALEVFEEYIASSLDHENPVDQMIFNAYSAKMFRRLAEESIRFQVKLPAGHPCEHQSGEVESLAKHFQQLALATAEKLDKRNGNAYYTTLLQQL